MDNGIIGVLRSMRDSYGEDIFYNSRRAKNLLNDLCPNMPQERIQAINFIELNGYFMLRYAGGAYHIVHGKLVDSYMATYRVDEQTARWTVNIFAVLLGYVTEAELARKAAPKPPPAEEKRDAIDDNRLTEILRKRVSIILKDYKTQTDEYGTHIVAASGPRPAAGGAADAMKVLRRPVSPIKTSALSNVLDHNHNHIAADFHTVAIRNDGTVAAAGDNMYGQCSVRHWFDIVSVAAGSGFTVGLRSDGTVTATGRNDYGQCGVLGWRDIIAVSAGARHTLGLRRDGVVMAAGDNRFGECDVAGWRNITAVFAGNQCTYAIKKDKRVLARGYHKNMEYDISLLSDITCVADANPHGALALRSDGTVVKARRDMKGNFEKLHSLSAITSTPDCFIGLGKNGTVRVMAYYWESSGVECAPDDWSDICEIAAGRYHLAGLRRDGTLMAAMLHTGASLDRGQCDVGWWDGLRV